MGGFQKEIWVGPMLFYNDKEIRLGVSNERFYEKKNGDFRMLYGKQHVCL